ncbi:hybrid sensor histidine kinase/response regulator [bacterium]|nr:MAG: hybrid sensor histidine kinase/response regulator [bacterium]
MASDNTLRRVLLIDDDEDDYFIIKRLFDKIPKSQFKLEWTGDIDKAGHLIGSDEHDIYLVDYRLGKSTGLELLEHFNLSQRRQPFIILTGAGDRVIEAAAMKLGTADYLVKGKFDADLLSRVLNYSLSRKEMEAQRVRELVEINESKDEFISLASHQLRTPATAVKQYIGMIIQGFVGDISEQQRDFLDRAYNSNERQLDIINDILRIARLDLDRIKLDRKEFDIRGLLQEIDNDLRPEFIDKKQVLELEMPDTPLLITADYTYLSTAINNIVDNANKYSRPKTSVTITAKQTDDTCILTITDHGVGIAKDEMSRLFKKFSRIPNPLSIEANGTGLGLYWSYEIIKLHGGTINVESEIESGTTFTVTIPRHAPLAEKVEE